MSEQYTLNRFMWDFMALWKSDIPASGPTIRALFRDQYQENAEPFFKLHSKVMSVFTDYVEKYRPGLHNRVEATPNSLVFSIFHLVVERGIEHPTRKEIEEAEATQTPQN